MQVKCHEMASLICWEKHATQRGAPWKHHRRYTSRRFVRGGLGLGACILIFDEPPFFAGDTILIGAVVCGTLGYFLGEGFIEWLKEIWWFW